MSDPRLDLLARRYQEILARLGARTSEQVALLWDQLGGITDVEQARFAQAATQVVEAAQRQAAMLADAYMRGYLGQMTGSTPTSALDLTSVIDLRGVPTRDVYHRPTVELRASLARGRTFAEAVSAARARATSSADTDVKMAARQTSRDTMVHNKVSHYRRVPDGAACTFCLTASTQRYKAADLMPLHSHCGCTVAPLASGATHIVDKPLLDRLKAASGRDDYWNGPKAAIAVHQHGELGPVLTQRGQHFTGPRGIAA